MMPRYALRSCVTMGDAAHMSEDFNGAKVALFVGDQLLITLRDDRADIPFPNMWDFPGGGREGRETPFETMVRETLEEVSLIVTREAVIWEKCYWWMNPAKLPSWFFVARLPTVAQARIALGDEGQDWALVSPDSFLAKGDAIPNLQIRLREWLSVSG